MVRRIARMVIIVCAVSVMLAPTAAAVSGDTAGGVATKFFRGAINMLTGWVEIPKEIQRSGEDRNLAHAFTVGLVKGIGLGYIRTIAGAYEVLTFPFPAPADYGPILDPPYVYTGGESTTGYPVDQN